MASIRIQLVKGNRLTPPVLFIYSAARFLLYFFFSLLFFGASFSSGCRHRKKGKKLKRCEATKRRKRRGSNICEQSIFHEKAKLETLLRCVSLLCNRQTRSVNFQPTDWVGVSAHLSSTCFDWPLYSTR